MLLTIQTGSLVDYFGVDRAFDMVKDAGFQGIDFSFCYWDRKEDQRFDKGYMDYAKLVKDALDKRNLVCRQAHGPMFMTYGLKFDETELYYKDIIHAMESASLMGAEYIVVHPINTPDPTEYEDYNFNFYKSLEPFCEKFKIKVAVENIYVRCENGTFEGRLHKAGQMTSLLKRLGEEYFAVCLDVGHAQISGENAENFISQIDPSLLKCLHLHETDGVYDLHLIPFVGQHNWSAILSALKEKGYQGNLNFEIDNFFRKLPRELVFDGLKYAGKIGKYFLNQL